MIVILADDATDDIDDDGQRTGKPMQVLLYVHEEKERRGLIVYRIGRRRWLA
jgi:hypothetical protein